jgi:protein SCO1/2
MNTSEFLADSSLPRRLLLNAAIAGIIAMTTGCGHEATPPKTTQKSGAAESLPKKASSSVKKVYSLVGLVKGINRDAREVQIRHEDIPGFMAAMTMPFRIKDKVVLDQLKVGDRVEGKLNVEEVDGMVSDYELTDLKVTEKGSEVSSPPQELVVSLAGGTPTLRVKPKALEVGEEVPDFSMTDQDGKTFKLSDFRGQVVVLTFVYTRCPLPDFCPMMDRKFSELKQRIERTPKRSGRIRLISVSFDPEHDTPEILKKHAALRGASPPLWTYAVASHEELARVAPRLGLVYGPTRDEIVHNLCTAVIDPKGKLARIEIGTSKNKWEPFDLLKTIDALITSQIND